MGTAPDAGRPTAKKAYSPEEIADELTISVRTVYRMMEDGRLRYRQISPGLRRIPADALDDLLGGAA